MKKFNTLKALKGMVKVMNPSKLNDPIFDGVPTPRKRRKETKPRREYKRAEASLSKIIQDDLSRLELNGRIVHWDRYNSGQVQTATGYWIKLCRKGTADLFFMLPGRLNVYLETKANSEHRKDQKLFQEKVEKAGHRYYLVNNVEEWEEIKNRYIIC